MSLSQGYEACRDSEAVRDISGSVGAGTGATVGKAAGAGRMMKSGLGAYAVRCGRVKCGAVAAVNALGDVRDYFSGEILAGLLTEDGRGFAGSSEVLFGRIEKRENFFAQAGPPPNTTLACVITNAALTKAQANKIASMAHDGFARTIDPVHTSADGDTIFVLASGEVEADEDALGALAAQVTGLAVNRGVLAAEPAYGLKAARDFRQGT